MTVPEGFTVKLFAGEPDVHAADRDVPGRSRPALGGRGVHAIPCAAPDKARRKDRILIFEDTDGDGKFDKRTVFMEGLNLVSGLEVGFGGVWIGAAPYLMFVPDRRRRRQAGRPAADSARRLGLRGHARNAQHLHLGAGRLAVRLPRRVHAFARRQARHAGQGSHADQRRHLALSSRRGTSSRSSPTARSNPWGLDFDEHGQAFIEACVIPHAYHIIQGGRYQRQAGSHFNPYTYDDIKTIADHRHYAGATPHGGNNRSDATGGGHAHCGLMIYLGGAWPEEYRGQHLHGQHPRPAAQHGHAETARLRLRRHRTAPTSCWPTTPGRASSTCATAPTATSTSSTGTTSKPATHGDPDIWDRTNGRIYKICYRGTKPVTGVDLAKKSDMELVDLVSDDNDWYCSTRKAIASRAKTQVGDLAGRCKVHRRC